MWALFIFPRTVAPGSSKSNLGPLAERHHSLQRSHLASQTTFRPLSMTGSDKTLTPSTNGTSH